MSSFLFTFCTLDHHNFRFSVTMDSATQTALTRSGKNIQAMDHDSDWFRVSPISAMQHDAESQTAKFGCIDDDQLDSLISNLQSSIQHPIPEFESYTVGQDDHDGPVSSSGHNYLTTDTTTSAPTNVDCSLNDSTKKLVFPDDDIFSLDHDEDDGLFTVACQTIEFEDSVGCQTDSYWNLN